MGHGLTRAAHTDFFSIRVFRVCPCPKSCLICKEFSTCVIGGELCSPRRALNRPAQNSSPLRGLREAREAGFGYEHGGLAPCGTRHKSLLHKSRISGLKGSVVRMIFTYPLKTWGMWGKLAICPTRCPRILKRYRLRFQPIAILHSSFLHPSYILPASASPHPQGPHSLSPPELQGARHLGTRPSWSPDASKMLAFLHRTSRVCPGSQKYPRPPANSPIRSTEQVPQLLLVTPKLPISPYSLTAHT